MCTFISIVFEYLHFVEDILCILIIPALQKQVLLLIDFTVYFQFMLPAIVHIMNQPHLLRGDGPIVSVMLRVDLSLVLIFHLTCSMNNSHI